MWIPKYNEKKKNICGIHRKVLTAIVAIKTLQRLFYESYASINSKEIVLKRENILKY